MTERLQAWSIFCLKYVLACFNHRPRCQTSESHRPHCKIALHEANGTGPQSSYAMLHRMIGDLGLQAGHSKLQTDMDDDDDPGSSEQCTHRMEESYLYVLASDLLLITVYAQIDFWTDSSMSQDLSMSQLWTCFFLTPKKRSLENPRPPETGGQCEGSFRAFTMPPRHHLSLAATKPSSGHSEESCGGGGEGHGSWQWMVVRQGWTRMDRKFLITNYLYTIILWLKPQAFDSFDVGIEHSSKSIRQWSCGRDGRGKIASAVSGTSWPQEGSFPAWWPFHWFYSVLESLLWLNFQGSQAFGGWSLWCVQGYYCLEHLWPVFRLWLQNQDFRCGVQSYLPWLCPKMDARPPRTCVRCMHPVVGHLASQTQPKRRKRGWRPRKSFKRRLRHTWNRYHVWRKMRRQGTLIWKRQKTSGTRWWMMSAYATWGSVKHARFNGFLALPIAAFVTIVSMILIIIATGSEIVSELETIDPSFSLCSPWCA